ncbi:hypothetical protein ES705_42461 [subsurface metagenome]
MAVKTITVRLPQSTYERLCQLADSSEELPSEMARNILREFLANFGKTEAKSAGGTKTELSPALKRILGRETQPKTVVKGRLVEGDGGRLKLVD